MPWRRLNLLSAFGKRNLTTKEINDENIAKRHEAEAEGFMSNNRKLKAPRVLGAAADFPATNYVILVFIERGKQ